MVKAKGGGLLRPVLNLKMHDNSDWKYILIAQMCLKNFCIIDAPQKQSDYVSQAEECYNHILKAQEQNNNITMLHCGGNFNA